MHHNPLLHQNDTVLITGASRGLGFELVKVFLERGWTVFSLVRNEASISSFVSKWPRRCLPIVADVASDDILNIIPSVLLKKTERLDILINNAGILGWAREIDHLTPAEMATLFNVHCIGTMRCVKGALPFLRKGVRSKIINISSRYGSLTRNARGEFKAPMQKVMYAYRIAKAAQNMLTLCLNQELSPKGIRVCSVHPGKLKTQSGPPDADQDPYKVAKELFHWIVCAKDSKNGVFYDLTTQYYGEW